MTDAHVEALKKTLKDMFHAIEAKENIVDHLTKLDSLHQQISEAAPAQLRHFLERRSYAKALELLETGIVIDDPNRPDCDEDEPHP